jgi:hypothetical protein
MQKTHHNIIWIVKQKYEHITSWCGLELQWPMKMIQPNEHNLLKNGPIYGWLCWDIAKFEPILNKNNWKVTGIIEQAQIQVKAQQMMLACDMHIKYIYNFDQNAKHCFLNLKHLT